MTYGVVKSQFLGILNRRDITPSQVDTFMQFAIQRIQTEVRVPAMEKVSQLLTDGSSKLTVPDDLLEFISVHTNDTTNHNKLIRTDLQTILTQSQLPGIPRFYHREGGYIYIGPFPPTGTSVFVHYYSDASSITADADVNWLTEVTPTLLIYGALSFAADYFLDDRKVLFEQTYAGLRDNLISMAIQDELQNASVSPSFSDGGGAVTATYYGW